MTDLTKPKATQLLAQIGDGHASAADELFPLVYEELRALATSFFRGQGKNHTLQPTAVVHEAYAKIVKPVGEESRQSKFENRAHFLAVAAKAMRQVLSNHSRDRQALKRGGGWNRITLSEALTPTGERDLDLIDVDEALIKLTSLDEMQGRVVELRFFSGMTNDEIAHVLGVSDATVEREWRMAKAWLSARLRPDAPRSAEA